jgi:hypothetical protein
MMTDEERAGIAGREGLSQLSKELSEAEVRAKTEQVILREYARLNLDPIYCGTSDLKFAGMLVSSSLVRLINKNRLPPDQHREASNG